MVWYCTRGDVKTAMDMAVTARDDRQVDRLIESASRSIESLCHRVFYPHTATKYFDWPNDQMGRSYRLWLDANELITATTVVAGGTTVTDYFLEPYNYGPPYDRLELNISSTQDFGIGSTFQRDIAITGVYGYSAATVNGGVLAGAVNGSVTAVTVSDASLVDVGNLIQVGSEWMQVTAAAMATTGQTLQTPVTASSSDVTVSVADGTALHAGEVVLLGSERMLITDVTGNNATVRRAWDGTLLATHTGSTVYALRALTVVRGAVGSTAASHLDASALGVWDIPSPVRALCVAEALNGFQQEQGAYARSIGSGDNVRNASTAGIEDIRDSVYRSHGRKARIRVV